MKYIVTLKRKETLNASQNSRMKREEVNAHNESAAKGIALFANNNGKYFVVDSVRRA